MRNKIRETIDTSISKLVISVSDKKYQEVIDNWIRICPDESKEILENLPKSIKDAILSLIPRIKEISYEDHRNDETGPFYKCDISFTCDVVNPLNGEQVVRNWFSCLNDAVYAGKKVSELSEEELRVLSLSFCIETLALIPTYIEEPLYIPLDAYEKDLADAWAYAYKVCYPDVYKYIVNKSGKYTKKDYKPEVVTPDEQSIKIKWEPLEMKDEEPPVKVRIRSEKFGSLGDIEITKKTITTGKPHNLAEVKEKAKDIEKEIEVLEKKIKANNKHLSLYSWFITAGQIVFFAFMIKYLGFTTAISDLVCSILGLGLSYAGLNWKSSTSIDSLKLGQKIQEIKDGSSREYLLHAIDVLDIIKKDLMK